VWSWAKDEPSAAGECALLGTDGRFHAADCGETHPYACRTASGWAVSGSSGAWSGGVAACGSETFAVPSTGYDDELLKSTSGSSAVWLNYADGPGGWTPGP